MNRITRRALNLAEDCSDLSCRVLRLFGKRLYFGSHDGESLTRLARARSLNRRVQRQDIRLFRDLGHRDDDLANRLCSIDQSEDASRRQFHLLAHRIHRHTSLFDRLATGFSNVIRPASRLGHVVGYLGRLSSGASHLFNSGDRLRDTGRRAAPVTVYRALDFLIANRLAHRLASQNAYLGCDHPEESHGAQFLICRRCGTTGELNDSEIAAAIAKSAEETGFRIEAPVVEITGLCPRCRAPKDRDAHDE